jgi:sec-independent protein translocase protein TatA
MGLESPFHILILVLAILLVFGARRLPEIGRSLGAGMREFKDAVTGDSKPPEITAAVAPPEQPVPTPVAAAPPESPPAPQG